MNKEDNKMARETQKEKIARLETELAQAINQRDAAIADALASNSKLNAKHDVSDSPMYQSLLLDREQWKRIAKNRQDQIKKNELRYDELLTMYKDLEQQLKGSQAMQADPENQQTAYKELQTEHERLKTEYETVKTLCERTLEAYNAIQNDYKALQVDVEREHRYCKKVEESFLQELNQKKPKSIDEVSNIWYQGRDGRNRHYHESRYHCLNLHSVFQKGTIDFRLFNSNTNAGKIIVSQ